MSDIKENFENKKNATTGGISETKKGIQGSIESKKNAITEGISETKKGIQDSIENKTNALKGDIAETKQKIGASLDAGKKTVSSFFKKLFIGIGLLALLAGIGYLVFANMTYSDGSRTGELVKISEKGMLFKTYEGQLQLGGVSMEKGATNIGSMWNFSVTDEAVFQKIQSLEGQKVVVAYEQKYRALPWKGDTKYLITDVEAVK